MKASPVDPRYVTMESDHPAYRVDFWEGNAAAEWRLEDARDAHEVWAWVEQNAEGRNPVVYVELTIGATVAIARLSGSDPTRIL